jgi:hypothetical protein
MRTPTTSHQFVIISIAAIIIIIAWAYTMIKINNKKNKY